MPIKIKVAKINVRPGNQQQQIYTTGHVICD